MVIQNSLKHLLLIILCFSSSVAFTHLSKSSHRVKVPTIHPFVHSIQSKHKRKRNTNHHTAPPEALPDIFLPNIDITEDERVWVPQTDCLWFRPLCFCVSQGYYVNLLRFRGGGTLGCHRHSSPVHAYTLKGKWGYKENDWEASPGSYVFEPPGETHTLVVSDDCDEMITLFHVTGSLLYMDQESGESVVGFDDVFTKLEKAKKWYSECGLGEDYVQKFV